MNKLVYTLPLAFIAVAGISYLFFAPSGLEKETAPLVVEDIEAISAKWSADELRERTDPGLIKAMSSQGQSPEELMHIYSELGALKASPKCRVHNTSSTIKKEERFTQIAYECAAEYAKGPATISITLSKGETEKRWMIYYINIHSEVFGEVIE